MRVSVTVSLVFATLAVALGAGVPLVAQYPPLPPESARYLDRRLKDAKRDLEAVNKQLDDARKRNRKNPAVDWEGRFITPPEVSLLISAVHAVQSELGALAMIEQRKKGKPIGGDPNANVSVFSSEAVSLAGYIDVYRRKRDDAEMMLQSRRDQGQQGQVIELGRREVAAYDVLIAATVRRQETADHLLAALGVPTAAEIAATRQRAAEAAAENERLSRARRDAAGREAIGAVVDAVGAGVSAFAAAMSEMRNDSFTDLGPGGEAAKRSGTFTTEGLRHGDMILGIYSGAFDRVPRDVRRRLALEGYVVKFSRMCESSLPPDRVELVSVPVETLVTKRLNGVEVNRQTVYGEPIRSGIFAAPAFARAYARVTGPDLLDVFIASSGGLPAAIQQSTEMRVDIRRLLARYGCDGAVTRQFAANLLRLTQ